jgi:hypothetical protein
MQRTTEYKIREAKRMAIVVRGVMLLLALVAAAPAARAINIAIDYTYDSSDFFGAGNPNGAAAGLKAKASLEAAANFFSGILDDTFAEIVTPPVLESSQYSGVAYWTWSLNFNHPATGSIITLSDQTIQVDEYRIYAGARSLGMTTLGRGGPGGWTWAADNNDGLFSPAENAQISATTQSFSDAVVKRGETSGFARWGGAVAFNSVGTLWHYDHTVPNSGTSNDFYSVAIHELAHALGFGGSAEWTALAGGSTFGGLAAKAANGGIAPPLAPPDPTRSHWQSGLMSEVLGTTSAQEAAMDPEITTGTRKYFTKLDAAALTDIGWTVVPLPPSYNPADFNEDTFVNGADLAEWELAFGATSLADADGDNDSDGNDFLIWQRELGNPAAASVPEPSALALACAGGITALALVRRRQSRQAASSGRR